MVYFLFIQILKSIQWAKSGDPDQTPHNVAPGLVYAAGDNMCILSQNVTLGTFLHCWPMSHKKDTRMTCILIKNQVEPWWAHLNHIH